MGRPRKVRTAEEEREYNARRKEQQRLAQQRRRHNNPEYVAREAERKRQARQQNPEYAAREAERMRHVRQHDAEYVARELERKRRARREDSEIRNAENAAKRHKYHDELLSKFKGANAKLKKFHDLDFGFACSVCDRLWFQDDLACISNVTNAAIKKKSALGVLARDFPGDDVTNSIKVCGACKDSTGLRLLEPSSAAQYASSKTMASFVAGKSNSLTQCGVPVVFKSSQANLKPKSKSVGVQTQHGRKISAGLVRGKSSAARMVTGHCIPPEVTDIALRLWEELQSRHSATAP